MDITYCNSCGLILDEIIDVNAKPRQVCPNCDSTKRVYDVVLSFDIVVRDKWKFVNKRPGVKKPVWEVTVGADLYRKSGQWNNLEMHIDRENDKYFKKVVDPRTGEIIRECNEPLSKHTDRGSAKKKNES